MKRVVRFDDPSLDPGAVAGHPDRDLIARALAAVAPDERLDSDMSDRALALRFLTARGTELTPAHRERCDSYLIGMAAAHAKYDLRDTERRADAAAAKSKSARDQMVERNATAWKRDSGGEQD